MADISLIRILYMEDDPGLSVLLRKSLQRRGFAVDTAANGEEGLAMAEANSYDLLLVDYNMPFMGGMDVLKALSSKGLPVPLIMVTGEGNEAIAVQALKLGASDYLVKDTEMRYLDLLVPVIDQVLYKQHLIKERNLMQDAVRESEERYRKLVELCPDGIALHVKGNLAFINTAGARLIGAADPALLIGKSVYSIIHADFKEMAQSRVRRLESDSKTASWIEQKFVRLDGTVMDVEVASVNFSYEGQSAVQTIFRDITERKLVERRLKQLALYDTLTGLPNRTLFFDRIRQLLELTKRNSYILALLYMDLDHFKDVNDRLGHEVGDQLLVEAARRMTGCTRKADTVARMGGDEFIGICCKISAREDAKVVAEKIITALSQPFHINGHECRIGVSIGISLYPGDGDDVETLLNRADQAMYRVKTGGKGGYLLYRNPADIEQA
jgi:diguanylate cyclase (GGDEF)-like protein/PAS domain S-box-containing protein